MFLDSADHVWHVAKDGNDGNGGHAQQYPVDTSADAKLTISAAVAAAADGDIIVIWPGDYAEQVDLSAEIGMTLIGTGWRTRIVKSEASFLVKLGDECILKNLAIDNTQVAASTCYSIYSDGKSRIRIDNCYLKGNGIGIYLKDSGGNYIQNSIIHGGEYAISLGSTGAGMERTHILNCQLDTSGWSICWSATLGLSAVEAIVKDCLLRTHMGSSDSNHRSCAILGNAITGNLRLLLDNCVLFCESDSGTYQHGIYNSAVAPGTKADVLIKNSKISVSGSAANDFDIISAPVAGTNRVVVVNCDYIPTKISGTIIQLPTIDSSGRIDVGKWLGSAVTLSGGSKPDVNVDEISDDAIAPDTLELIVENAKGADHKLLISSDAQDLSATLDVNTKLVVGATPITLANINAEVDTAIFAKTGITAGGSWTFSKIIKMLTAWAAGKWQDKSGSPGTYEVLDAEDGTTKILEVTPSETSPQKDITVS